MIVGHIDSSLVAAVTGVLLAAALGGIGHVVRLIMRLRDDMQARDHAAVVAVVDVKKRVGEPNGQGNVIQMLEKILEGQAAQDARLANHDIRIAVAEQRQAETDANIAALEGT